MLGTLPESRRRRERRFAGILTSAFAHAGVILAVVGTASARPPAPEPTREVLLPMVPPTVEKPPLTRSGGETGGAPAAPSRPEPVLRAPDEISVDIPPVDPGTSPAVDDDFRTGLRGAIEGTGEGTAVGGPPGDAILSLHQVEKPVVQLPTPRAVRYPPLLRTAGAEGEVNARFVVDTTGRVEPGSFSVLESTHELFTSSVRASLPGLRFVPAEAGGRRVRQLVEQRFVFALQR